MGNVAPHLNNEVRLVLGGLKPLATIEKDKDDIQYCLAVQLAGTGMLSIHYLGESDRDSRTGEVVFTRSSNRELIPEYLELLHTGVSNYGIKAYHRRMGRLFGYSEADIQEFITAEIHCTCSKCTGE